MATVRINLSRRAQEALEEFARRTCNSRAERQALRKSVLDSVRTTVAKAKDYPKPATRDTRFTQDLRWFECHPAFLVLAMIQRTVVKTRFVFFDEVSLDVTVHDFNFSPDLLLRKP